MSVFMLMVVIKRVRLELNKKTESTLSNDTDGLVLRYY